MFKLPFGVGDMVRTKLDGNEIDEIYRYGRVASIKWLPEYCVVKIYLDDQSHRPWYIDVTEDLMKYTEKFPKDWDDSENL